MAADQNFLHGISRVQPLSTKAASVKNRHFVTVRRPSCSLPPLNLMPFSLSQIEMSMPCLRASLM